MAQKRCLPLGVVELKPAAVAILIAGPDKRDRPQQSRSGRPEFRPSNPVPVSPERWLPAVRPSALRRPGAGDFCEKPATILQSLRRKLPRQAGFVGKGRVFPVLRAKSKKHGHSA
jgi:hypothetical protein